MYLIDLALLLFPSPLAQTHGLADAVAEEVQLGPSHHTAADDIDLLNLRRMERELSFDALVGYDPADRTDQAVLATRRAVFPLRGMLT